MDLEKRIEALEKKVAELEGLVQEQPKIKARKQIIENQINVLEKAQQNCMKLGLWTEVSIISKIILEVTTTNLCTRF